MTFVIPIADVLTQAGSIVTPLLPLAVLLIGVKLGFMVFGKIKRA